MPTLYLHDTKTGAQRAFNSHRPGEVSLYVCGITVYGDCHIGHARCMLAFDTLYRFLSHLGYRVRYVRNITDVDDKIIARADEEGIDARQLTERYIRSMREDFAALGLSEPSIEPLATEHITQMQDLVAQLIDKGYAYVGSNGDVFFAVRKDQDYGCLSRKNLDEILVGARVENNPAKRDPLDFVLWKQASADQLGWDSEWGRGRPGWHLECSAMSMAYLGKIFDIHGGGSDLCFPHHENEWAQSRCATQAPFAQYWLHSGFVQIEEEKMSKSLSNTVSIKQVLDQYHPEVLRWLFLSSHYRSEVVYSEHALREADRSLRRFYMQFDAIVDISPPSFDSGNEWLQAFELAMCDDLNTPKALAVLHKLDNHINKTRELDSSLARQNIEILRFLGGVLGLFGQDPSTFLRGPVNEDSKRIDDLVHQRWQHRQAGRWPQADQIRDQLAQENIVVEDRSDASIWYRTA